MAAGAQGSLVEDVLLRRGSDPHHVLGVPSSCTSDHARGAFRKLALQLHPDKNSHPSCAEAFQVIAAAFEAIQAEERGRGATWDVHKAPCTGPHPPPNKWADFSQWCEDKEGDVSAFGPNAFGSYGKCTAGGTERRASGGAEGEAVKAARAAWGPKAVTRRRPLATEAAPPQQQSCGTFLAANSGGPSAWTPGSRRTGRLSTPREMPSNSLGPSEAGLEEENRTGTWPRERQDDEAPGGRADLPPVTRVQPAHDLERARSIWCRPAATKRRVAPVVAVRPLQPSEDNDAGWMPEEQAVQAVSPSAARELDRCRGLWGSLYQPFAGHLERSSDECSDAGREDEDELARESSLSFEAGETDDVLGASFDPFSAGGMASSEDDGANAAEDNSRETVTPPEPKTTRSCLLQMLQQLRALPQTPPQLDPGLNISWSMQEEAANRASYAQLANKSKPRKWRRTRRRAAGGSRANGVCKGHRKIQHTLPRFF